MVDIGAIVQGAVGTGEAIWGLIQSSGAKKDLEKLIKKMPKYSRPEEYKKLLSIYEQQAGMGQLPGQNLVEADLSTRTARGSRAVGKYADNPVAAAALTAGLYGKEQQAIRDLGIQFADFQSQSKTALAGAYKMGADYADKEFSYNKWYPHQIKMNMKAAEYNEGKQMFYGGLDTMAASGANYGSFGMGGSTGSGSGSSGGSMGGGMSGGLSLGSVNVGSSSPTSSYGYYNPQMAGQFVPQLGTSPSTPALGSNWGQWGSWTPTN